MNPIDFIHDLSWDDIPASVRHQAKRCFIDTIGVAMGGRVTPTSKIIYNHAARCFGGQDTKLWFDGRTVSAPGAAMAHGMTIDSLDMHDSCRPVKGHAGIAQVPAVMAMFNQTSRGDISGRELITALAVAYDIAIRAGTAQHATVCDYHTSGSWNALGCAAVGARFLGLNKAQTREALGIAEYHGPRSQMMRAIDFPSMVKDGSGWGAMAGLSAAYLAADGFTGAPAITVEADNTKEFWDDLGSRWSLDLQYFKPYAVCYWSQAAIAGALKVQKAHDIQTKDIIDIEVYTFHEASRLATRFPKDSDEAQYSLPFPVAGALVHGQLGYAELNGEALRDEEVLRLSAIVKLIDDDSFNARFPAERLSRVVIETKDGNRYDSEEVRPLWDLSTPPGDDELLDKFRQLANGYLPATRVAALEAMIWNIETVENVSDLAALLYEPR